MRVPPWPHNPSPARPSISDYSSFYKSPPSRSCPPDTITPIVCPRFHPNHLPSCALSTTQGPPPGSDLTLRPLATIRYSEPLLDYHPTDCLPTTVLTECLTECTELIEYPYLTDGLALESLPCSTCAVCSIWKWG